VRTTTDEAPPQAARSALDAEHGRQAGWPEGEGTMQLRARHPSIGPFTRREDSLPRAGVKGAGDQRDDAEIRLLQPL